LIQRIKFWRRKGGQGEQAIGGGAQRIGRQPKVDVAEEAA
jgi:hypothetical protein